MSEIKPWRENIGKPEAYMIMCDVLDVLCEKEAIKKAVYERLKQAPSTYEWIPCSERLPEEKGEYLVAYHPCHWDDVEAEVKVGVDSFRGKTSWAKQKYQRVIAWMPLPPVYQEEDNK